MPVTLRGRPSIHKDEKSKEEDEEVNNDEEEKPHQCSQCNKFFIKSKGGVQTKLSKEDLEKWLAEKKSNIYPNLSRVTSVACRDCGFTPECAFPDRPDSVGGKNYFSMITSFLFGLSVLVAFAVAAPTGDWIKAWVFGEVNLDEASVAEKYFDDKLDSIEQKFPNQEDKVWEALGGGIKLVQKNDPNRPSVFMFLYDSESAGNTAKCLATDVSYLASAYLKRTTKKRPLVLNGLQLNNSRLIEDHGRMLVDYNGTVQDNGAMVILNLQDVPPEVAKSLHFFCDAYSPLIETAIYIFTLKVDDIPKHAYSPLIETAINLFQGDNIPKYKITDTARNKLIELWGDKMPHGTIEALITRLTPNVVRINSDTAEC